MSAEKPSGHTANPSPTPVLLLKTKSTPTDGYEEYFSAADNGRYQPIFVPVLEHRFREEALASIVAAVYEGGFGGRRGKRPAKWGGIIFTSQRAVEAFAGVINTIREDVGKCQPGSLEDWIPPIPLYVVGPATARGLRALGLQNEIIGEETGNGEALAEFMLKHYNGLHSHALVDQDVVKPPLLFLVGEQRRDIIPRKLQSPDSPEKERIGVHELVIYETGEMLSFKTDFRSVWSQNASQGVERQWVVVFSPTGCKAMLETLDMIDHGTGKAKTIVHDTNGSERKTTHIATIGPTTRDYLVNEFGLEPDVCAAKPSPKGIGTAIETFDRTPARPEIKSV
ncbi:hypothetical protein LTR04_000024 [Oleoguttula sp. CCFEE 6159]|nr:hypothetical protein LTR04_000024 [Oleoguttula sp. CCFEE 6159]